MTNGVKTKLVFHFHVQEDFLENVFYMIHLKCLKKYINNFDEAVFVVTYNEGDEELAAKAREEIVKLGFRGDLTLKTRQNTAFREAETFKNEVVDPYFDGLIFFAHTKGTTNVNFSNVDISNVYHWVLGMYFINLNSFEQVCSNIIKYSAFAHGYLPLQSESDCPYSKYHWAFMGTFQWINIPLLKEYVRNNEIELPSLSSRFYAETFLGNIIPCTGSGAFMPILSNVNSVSIVEGPKNYFYGHRELMISELGLDTVSDVDKLYNEIFEND